jgi:hypothetical protein
VQCALYNDAEEQKSMRRLSRMFNCIDFGKGSTGAIRNITSVLAELLTKQAMTGLLYTRYAYTLKLLLNIVAAGYEALIISGNKFLYACMKEVCHL